MSTESANFKRLQARLRGLVGKAIADFGMIEAGDRVMVCLSGGKDSYTLLDLLLSLQRAAPVEFEIVAVNLDQKQPGFPAHVLPEYLRGLGVPFTILEQDTYSVVKRVVPAGRTQCGLCSRLRRGALYRYAREHGIDKIALGHHRDDIVETLFLNLFHAGRLKAMPPKLLSEDGRNVVIRPLCYVPEREIVRYARARAFPIIPCTLCGSQPNLERKAIAGMLAGWEQAHPGRIDSIFRAIGHVSPSQLADPALFDFASLVRRAADSMPGDGTRAGGATSVESGAKGSAPAGPERARSETGESPADEVGADDLAGEFDRDDALAEAMITGIDALEDWRERGTMSPVRRGPPGDVDRAQ
jgi:tRNA 2-thiocytidine biosynthesis protein TtcA